MEQTRTAKSIIGRNIKLFILCNACEANAQKVVSASDAL